MSTFSPVALNILSTQYSSIKIYKELFRFVPEQPLMDPVSWDRWGGKYFKPISY